MKVAAWIALEKGQYVAYSSQYGERELRLDADDWWMVETKIGNDADTQIDLEAGYRKYVVGYVTR